MSQIRFLLEARSPSWFPCYPVMPLNLAIGSCPRGKMIIKVLICQNENINQQANFILTSDSANFPKLRRWDWVAQCRTEIIG